MSRKKLNWVVAFLLIALALLSYYGFSRAKGAEYEARRLADNQVVLLSEIDRYKVADSLSAVQTAALKLSLSEYKELYSSECETVRRLKADIKGLQGTISTQTETIRVLKAQLKPIVVHDTVLAVIDTLQCFDYSDRWIDVSGCIDGDTVSISVASRDELIIVESLQRKRFLGIPLPIRLFGYKTRTADAMSLNPNTTISGVEYKVIER